MVVVVDALTNLANSFVLKFPSLVYAIIALIVGYVLGKIVGEVVRRVLVHAKIDQYADAEHHLSFKTSSVLAVISKWIIYLIFLQQSAELLGVMAITSALEAVVAFIPGVVGALVVLVAAYAIGIYTKEQIIGKGRLYTSILGKVMFFLILYVGIAVALPLLGIDAMLINAILLVIVGSIGLGLALALGLGLKDTVKELAKTRVKKYARK